MRAITLDSMTPVSVRRMAPEANVTTQEAPCGCVELVARDRDGVVRFRLSMERDARMIRWWTQGLRLALALFYSTVDVELKLIG